MAEPSVSPVSASRADVEAILVRSLTQQENTYVDVLLGRAQRLIQHELADSGLSPDPQLVFDVQASMVARALTNSEGKVSEADGQYSYTLADRSLPGDGLYLSGRDRELLGLVKDGGVFLWNPQYGSPTAAGSSQGGAW